MLTAPDSNLTHKIYLANEGKSYHTFRNHNRKRNTTQKLLHDLYTKSPYNNYISSLTVYVLHLSVIYKRWEPLKLYYFQLQSLHELHSYNNHNKEYSFHYIFSLGANSFISSKLHNNSGKSFNVILITII